MRAPPYAVHHVLQLLASHESLTGRTLVDRANGEGDTALAARLYAAPFVVLANGTEQDPLFNYANIAAQRLFELSWDELTCFGRSITSPTARGLVCRTVQPESAEAV